jgi:hypothetical protein
MLFSKYTYGKGIGFRMDAQTRGSERACTVATNRYNLSCSRAYLNIKLLICSYYTKINPTIIKMKEVEELIWLTDMRGKK